MAGDLGTALTAPVHPDSSITTAAKCLTDRILDHHRAHTPGFLARLEAMDLAVRQAGNEGLRQDLVIPVVVHVVHDNGEENIPDQQIIAGIEHLNDAFANAGNYTHADGSSTGIRFCLAARTPAGGYTNGITRTVSSLTELTAETQDGALKDLIRWDPDRYLNIWLVREITSAAMGPGVAGYAYFPTAQGMPEDGIVNEARFFGSSENNSKVHIHEAGHYLGLYHTFEGGCTNNDCRSDGDKVCDTPPDNSTAAVPCHTQPNTCQTDADDASAHNPFRAVALGGLGDQPDQFKNYMDYGYQTCQAYFSAGQAERMVAALTTQRAVLLSSDACEPPCTFPITVSIDPLSSTIEVGSSITFTSDQTGASSWEWTVDGTTVGSDATLAYPFAEVGNFTVAITAYNEDPNCIATAGTTVQVTCPAQATFTLLSEPPLQPGWIISAVSTSVNNTSTQWVLDGVPVGTDDTWSQSFTEVGGHALYLIAGNDVCADTSITHFFQVGHCDLSGVTDHWVFLNNQLRFVDGAPVLIPNSPIQDHHNECSASIADVDGNLLLASDGERVYDRDLNVMPNGGDLLGHRSSSQSVLITPHPGNIHQYVVFTTTAIESTEGHGMRYSIVDLTLNNGLGDVLPGYKNVPLLAVGSEKISATWHANGRDIWVGTGERTTNAWYAFLIDAQGVHATPVVSHIGAPPNSNPLGSMRFSNNGNRMAACVISTWPWRILVSDFDRATGVYSNPIELILSTEFNQQPFSLAFSPDDSKLYASFWQGQDAIFQYDLAQTTASGIMASRYSVTAPATFCSSGHLVLASNGKIYVRECVYTGLSEIQDPNAAGAACNYVRNVVPISAANNSGNSLPNMMQGFFLAHGPSIVGPRNICMGGEAYTYGVSFASQLDSAVWSHTGPSDFISEDGSPTAVLISGDAPAVDTITVAVHGRCGISYDTIVVHTNVPEATDLLADVTYGCEAVLLDPGAGFVHYAWSDGSHASTLPVSEPGTYAVMVQGASGCTIHDTTQVMHYPDLPPVDLGPDRSICDGQLAVLQPTGAYAELLWPDGSQGSTFTVYTPGTYCVRATSGCSATVSSDTIIVSLAEIAMDLLYQGQDRVCDTELPFTLDAPAGFTGHFWADGQNTSSILISAIGMYALTVIDADGCSAHDTLWVETCNGIADTYAHGELRIHPNPAADHFTVTSRLPLVGTLVLYSASGKVVHQDRMEHQGVVVVPVGQLADGLYVLELRSGDAIWREKVSVVR